MVGIIYLVSTVWQWTSLFTFIFFSFNISRGFTPISQVGKLKSSRMRDRKAELRGAHPYLRVLRHQYLLRRMLFPGGSDGKLSACNAGDLGLIPGLGRSPGEGNGNPLQYSCLENPTDGGAWWATSMGSQRVGHDWVTSLYIIWQVDSLLLLSRLCLWFPPVFIMCLSVGLFKFILLDFTELLGCLYSYLGRFSHYISK